jgi:hypothetical protein
MTAMLATWGGLSNCYALRAAAERLRGAIGDHKPYTFPPERMLICLALKAADLRAPYTRHRQAASAI